MKRILAIAAIAALLLPEVAAAQMGDRRGPDSHRPGGNNRPGGGGDHRPGGGGNNRPGGGGDHRPGGGGDHRPGGGGDHRPGPGIRPPHRPPAMRPPPRPQWSWRGRHYSRIRGPAFRYPSGYGYRRWTIGVTLPGLFLSSTYYFDDWRGIGLDAPGPNRRWVRYGPDLLLVNSRNGRVEDVIYGAFD